MCGWIKILQFIRSTPEEARNMTCWRWPKQPVLLFISDVLSFRSKGKRWLHRRMDGRLLVVHSPSTTISKDALQSRFRSGKKVRNRFFSLSSSTIRYEYHVCISRVKNEQPEFNSEEHGWDSFELSSNRGMNLVQVNFSSDTYGSIFGRVILLKHETTSSTTVAHKSSISH